MRRGPIAEVPFSHQEAEPPGAVRVYLGCGVPAYWIRKRGLNPADTVSLSDH